jgi:hypothetical protein
MEVYLHCFFNLSARWGWVANATPRPLYPGNDPVPIVEENGWAPGPVCTDGVKLAPTGVQSPDCLLQIHLDRRVGCVKKELRRISYSKKNEVTGYWTKLHNEKLHCLSTAHITKIMKARCISEWGTQYKLETNDLYTKF